MSRSSSSRERRRAPTEPLVALAAVLAISLGLSAFAVVLGGVGDPSAPAAGPALELVRDRVSVGGVADPDRLAGAVAETATPERHVNATLAAGGERWTAGEPSPASPSIAVDTAERRMGVALGPGRVRPGELRVSVWR